MMTLVPAFAFGAVAADTGGAYYSASASDLKVTKKSPDTYDAKDGDGTTAKFTISFEKANGDAVTDGVYFYIKSSSDAQIGWVEDRSGIDRSFDKIAGGEGKGSRALATKDGLLVFANPYKGDASDPVRNMDAGEVVFHIGSTLAGSFTVTLYSPGGEENGTKIDDPVTITVENGDGDIDLYAEDDDEKEIGKQGTPGLSINAGDGIEIFAHLTDGGNDIEGADITFKYSLDEGSKKTLGTDETDEDGIASWFWTPDEVGTYRYYAYGPSDAESPKNDAELLMVEVLADEADNLEFKIENGAKVAVDEDNDIDIHLTDKYGNDISNKKVIFKVKSCPSDSSLKDDEWDETTDEDGEATLNFVPDEIGSYTIEVKDVLKPRVKTTIEVEAVEFGDVVAITLSLENNDGDDITNIVFDGSEGYVGVYDVPDAVLIVKVVDDNGVELNPEAVSGDVDIKIAASKSNIVLINEVDQGKYEIEVNDEDFTGALTFTVVDTESGVSAQLNTEVVGDPTGIRVDADVNGLDADVTLQYVDENGKDSANDDEDGYSLVLPKGVSSKNIKDFDDAGVATFDLEAEAAGKYSITVITDANIAKTFEVNFSGKGQSGDISVGSDSSVVMFIGNAGYMQNGTPMLTDLAPFINNGRTFVAVRPIAAAFGCAIDWNPATQVVTLTRDDVVVTITIGSSDIVVYKDGVVETVTADVPAYIKDGRTVLPFRAVGDAFGATVSYDAATQSVSYTM